MEYNRLHDRVYLPLDSGVCVSAQGMGLLGPVRVIGLGGLFFQFLSQKFSVGTPLTLDLNDVKGRHTHRVETTIRDVNGVGVGVAFVDLPLAAATDVERLVKQYS
jgi:hypothetical protein